MKVRVTRLLIPEDDFSDKFRMRYMVEYKRYWWQRYKWLLAPSTRFPRLFANIETINEVLSAMGFKKIRDEEWPERWKGNLKHIN